MHFVGADQQKFLFNLLARQRAAIVLLRTILHQMMQTRVTILFSYQLIQIYNRMTEISQIIARDVDIFS